MHDDRESLNTSQQHSSLVTFLLPTFQVPSNFDTMISILSLSALSLLWPAVVRAQDCVGSISSMDDVAEAVKCQTVNINAFTVPPNVTFNLSLLDDTTVNMLGNVTFGVFNWAGVY